ncbi:MAG: ExbD/TolR family protein, partial [Pirellulaceae bacterium]
MVGTKFTDPESQLQLNLPRVQGSASTDPAAQRRWVNVYRNGTLTVDGQPVSLAQLQQTLRSDKSINPQIGVVVRGDGQVTHQWMMQVMNAVSESGIDAVRMAVVNGGSNY